MARDPHGPLDAVAAALGARSAHRLHRIQSLWSGYGEAIRVGLDDGRTVVVKDVHPPAGSGIGHARKLRSYRVEAAFYRTIAPRCPATCRVPTLVDLEEAPSRWLFILEDLCSCGFDREHGPLRAMLVWLAHFHATFLGEPTTGLWKVGTYWHLETRPDEHRRMEPGPLSDAAQDLDRVLREARHQTLVHGDAKPANFLFGPSGAAAVDFQYVGGGVGVKDVAYLLYGESRTCREQSLDIYFEALEAALPRSVDGRAVITEWRDLYPLAWADFHRFLAGWAPGHRVDPDSHALTQEALRRL